jgi:hypothetical protein
MSIFSDVKDTMATQLAALFTAASLTVTIKKYRTLDWTAATEDALLILSANSHGETAQLQDYVDVVVSTIVRYGNETEASAAETTLDDIDQVLINAYRSDGTHQKAASGQLLSAELTRTEPDRNRGLSLCRELSEVLCLGGVYGQEIYRTTIPDEPPDGGPGSYWRRGGLEPSVR